MPFEHRPPGDAIVTHARQAHRREQRPEIRLVSRNRPLRRNPAWNRWWPHIAAAISVVTAHTIDAFAMYAACMHPELFHPPSNHTDRRRLAEESSPGQRTADPSSHNRGNLS